MQSKSLLALGLPPHGQEQRGAKQKFSRHEHTRAGAKQGSKMCLVSVIVRKELLLRGKVSVSYKWFYQTFTKVFSS